MTPREKELARQLAECQEALAQSRRENQLLRQKIDLLVRRVFGSSSERLDRAQLELLLQLPDRSVITLEATPPSAVVEELQNLCPSFAAGAHASSAGEPAGGGSK